MSAAVTALVPVFPGRPPWVWHEDWHVCLAVHDAWFLRELSRQRRRLIEAQFDPNYRDVKDQYIRFLVLETQYYAQYKVASPIIMGRRAKGRASICRFCDAPLDPLKRHYLGFCDINCWRFREVMRLRGVPARGYQRVATHRARVKRISS